MHKKIVGIVSDILGYDPWHPQTFSGASFHFFNGLKKRELLHRAFGVQTSQIVRYSYLLKNFYPEYRTWRTRYHTDVSRRNILTEQIRRNLTGDDYKHVLLQLGSYYDAASAADGRAPCFSYHDASFAMSLKSPFVTKLNLSTGAVDRVLEYERKVNASMVRVFTFSNYLRTSFIQDYGIPPDSVITVGTGINIEAIPEFFPDKRYDSQEILFVGIEFERKGGWQLLEAFAAVRDRFPKAKLHIVGPKSLEIPPKWRNGVVFHGYLNKKIPSEHIKLLDITRRSSFFVLPSLYDPMANAPLEAMLNQLPAVVTNDWGFPEMVRPGEEGELVECKNVMDLETKLTSFLASPDRLRRMGEGARQRVIDSFTWDKVCQRLGAAIAESLTPDPSSSS